MKTIFIAVALLTTLASRGIADEFLARETDQLKTQLAQTETALQPAKTKASSGKLRHVVALKFKEGIAPEDIQKVENAFRDLKKKIPQIAALEWGTNNSPEKHDKGFTHCFILTFKSEKDRDIYLPHPDHKAFGKLLGPVLADVFVMDYWAKE